jgi:hypothetical protein
LPILNGSRPERLLGSPAKRVFSKETAGFDPLGIRIKLKIFFGNNFKRNAPNRGIL